MNRRDFFNLGFGLMGAAIAHGALAKPRPELSRALLVTQLNGYNRH